MTVKMLRFNTYGSLSSLWLSTDKSCIGLLIFIFDYLNKVLVHSDISIWREISNLTCKKSVGDCNANHVQEDEKDQEDLVGAKFHLTCKALF